MPDRIVILIFPSYLFLRISGVQISEGKGFLQCMLSGIRMLRQLRHRNYDPGIIFRTISRQNRSTEGCSKLRRSVDLTSSRKNGLNIRANASPNGTGPGVQRSRFFFHFVIA